MGYVVYNIVNPITNNVIYVGVTSNIENRKKTHIARTHNVGLKRELQEICDQGSEPIFNIIQDCIKAQAITTESYWIKFYIDEGYSLHNQSLNKNKTSHTAAPNDLVITNVSIRSKSLIAAKKIAKDYQIRGGLSGYIEKLLINDLKKKGVKLDA